MLWSVATVSTGTAARALSAFAGRSPGHPSATAAAQTRTTVFRVVSDSEFIRMALPSFVSSCRSRSITCAASSRGLVAVEVSDQPIHAVDVPLEHGGYVG